MQGDDAAVVGRGFGGGAKLTETTHLIANREVLGWAASISGANVSSRHLLRALPNTKSTSRIRALGASIMAMSRGVAKAESPSTTT
jgi:hypothetical protein